MEKTEILNTQGAPWCFNTALLIKEMKDKCILTECISKFQSKFTISNHPSRHTCFHLNYSILNSISAHMPVSEGYLSLSWSIKAKQILSFWGFSFLFCVHTVFTRNLSSFRAILRNISCSDKEKSISHQKPLQN